MIFRLSNDYDVPVLIYSEPDGESYTLDPGKRVNIEMSEPTTSDDPAVPRVDVQIRRELDEMYIALIPVGGTYTILEDTEDYID